jgi:hypothetical protein
LQLFILGLRRSGTTIFWQTFRQDSRLKSFNEPFNPVLSGMPVELPNGSRREFIEIFREDPARFWQLFAPISGVEELQSGLSDRQEAWFRFLLARTEAVSLDTTRCHFKLEALQRIAPDAVVVHLHRHPAAFASSHLIPSGSGGRRTGWLARRLGQQGFFSRHNRFHYWGIQSLVADDPASLFGQRAREIGMDPAQIYALPAVGRLLAFWRVAFEHAERDGRRIFGNRFVSLPFEDFCERPLETVKSIYAAGGMQAPQLDLSRVHPPSPAHRARDPRWKGLLEGAGLPTVGRPTAV